MMESVIIFSIGDREGRSIGFRIFSSVELAKANAQLQFPQWSIEWLSDGNPEREIAFVTQTNGLKFVLTLYPMKINLGWEEGLK